MGFPGDSVVKNLPANAGASGNFRFPLGQKDSLGEEMATHSSILAWKNPMDRGAWQATVQRVTKSQTWLNDWAHTKISLGMAHAVYGSQHWGLCLADTVITASSTWAHLVLRLTLNIICCQFSSYSRSQRCSSQFKSIHVFQKLGKQQNLRLKEVFTICNENQQNPSKSMLIYIVSGHSKGWWDS